MKKIAPWFLIGFLVETFLITLAVHFGFFLCARQVRQWQSEELLKIKADTSYYAVTMDWDAYCDIDDADDMRKFQHDQQRQGKISVIHDFVSFDFNLNTAFMDLFKENPSIINEIVDSCRIDTTIAWWRAHGFKMKDGEK